MTRKKIKIAFITNNSARKASFNKRKQGLMKKVEELSTLCDIDICAIIYGLHDKEPADVWPPSPHAVQSLISRFKRLPEMEKISRLVNQEGFAKKMVQKLEKQIKNQQIDNRVKEAMLLMYQCLADERLQNFSMDDLNDMGWAINRSLKEISWRIEFCKKSNEQPGPDD